jgi:uncharacterized protein
MKMFRILSLDGGGIRGAFAAAFLARLEEELAHPITDYFDLITGTSTGGIIALALGLREPASRIKQLYEERGPAIFTRRPPTPLPLWQHACLALGRLKFPGLEGDGLHRSRYDAKALRDGLVDVYGVRTMEDATACRLVIPAVDLIYGRTVTFKTPHQPDFIRDRRIPAVDVGLATAAAPTFFPHARIGPGSAYSDGGLWANNPAIVGYVEALKIREVCQRPDEDPEFALEDVHMLSIGTGEPQYFAKPEPTDDGLLWWGPRLFDVASGAQSQGAHFQAQYLMGKDRYTRVDFKMPTQPWRLDEVSALPQLLHYGVQAAIDHYPRLRHTLFETEKPPYHPFPKA